MAKLPLYQRTKARIMLLILNQVNLRRQYEIVLGKPLDRMRGELDDHMSP